MKLTKSNFEFLHVSILELQLQDDGGDASLLVEIKVISPQETGN